jgi:hypothetical protein
MSKIEFSKAVEVRRHAALSPVSTMSMSPENDGLHEQTLEEKTNR